MANMVSRLPENPTKALAKHQIPAIIDQSLMSSGKQILASSSVFEEFVQKSLKAKTSEWLQCSAVSPISNWREEAQLFWRFYLWEQIAPRLRFQKIKKGSAHFIFKSINGLVSNFSVELKKNYGSFSSLIFHSPHSFFRF